MPRYPAPDQCAKRRCVLGRCLEEERICDRVWDCQDGGDELGCDYIRVDSADPNVTVTCQPESRPGGASSSRCICPSGFGKCRSKDICLPMNLFCNGEDNCGDGSDEDAECTDCLSQIKFSTPQLLCDGEIYHDYALHVGRFWLKGAGSFHIHRKTMKELCTLAVLGVREQPNLAQNLVTHRH